MKLGFKLTAIDSIIIQESNKTVGFNACLDYVPGSALLGYFASKLYSQLPQEQSWELFHSGAVQFGNAYPIADNELSLPLPLSFHYPKGQDAKQINELTSFTNQVEESLSVQWKQMRAGYINSQGLVGRPFIGVSTKSAIDPKTGTVEDGKLFTYEHIQAGAEFAGVLTVTTPELTDLVKQSAGEIVRIGRSKNTEFGRMRIEFFEVSGTHSVSDHGDTITVWFVADAQVINSVGEPVLRPTLTELFGGYPSEHSAGNNTSALSARLDEQSSFVRTRRVSRYNQKRGVTDTEQVLIEKGSVLVYRDVSGCSKAMLEQLQAYGVGMNKQAGLGQVVINPLWSHQKQLNAPLFNAKAVKVASMSSSGAITETPKTALMAWMQEQVAADKKATVALSEAKNLTNSIVKLYDSARYYNTIAQAHQAGPSQSQWRRIQSALKQQPETLARVLFDGEHAICKAKNDAIGWGIQWKISGNDFVCFADAWHDLFAQYSVDTVALCVEQICRFDLSTYQGLKAAKKEFEVIS